MQKKEIDRINELAHKAKTEDLPKPKPPSGMNCAAGTLRTSVPPCRISWPTPLWRNRTVPAIRC